MALGLDQRNGPIKGTSEVVIDAGFAAEHHRTDI